MKTDILEKFIDTLSLVNTLEHEREYDLARTYSKRIVAEVLKEIYTGKDSAPAIFYEYECSMCGTIKSDVTIRTRNSMFVTDISNYHVVCEECDELDWENMQELWDDVYSDIRASL